MSLLPQERLFTPLSSHLRPINGDDLNKNYLGIVQAFQAGNEAVLRKRNEEVINQIVGDGSDQYRDYDKDGQIDNPGDGYGSLSNGEDRLGYLQESFLAVKSTIDAPDSTPNVRTNGENVQACIRNMEAWTNEILRLAQELNRTSMGPEMKATIDQLSTLGDTLVHGVDANGSGFVDPIVGECGADTAYEDAYYMADMQIYIGPDRIPPSGK